MGKNLLLIMIFLLIETIGIFGNIFVICSVQFDHRMRQSLTNQLIVRIASCDLAILLFNLPDLIQNFLSENGNWILNEYFCRLIRTILVLSEYVSVLTMCILTFERFIGIVYPFRRKIFFEKKHFLFITIFIWIFSLICSSPNLIFLKLIENSEQRIRLCLLQYSSTNPETNFHFYLLHKTIESILFYFLPLILQLYCYVRIVRQLSHIDHSLQTTFQQHQVILIHCSHVDWNVVWSTLFSSLEKSFEQSFGILSSFASQYLRRIQPKPSVNQLFSDDKERFVIAIPHSSSIFPLQRWREILWK